MIIVKGTITKPKGFLAGGVKAGIKKSGRRDLALIYSEVPAVAAGAFTSNAFQASPVRVSKAHLRNKVHQAIIVNSGNANCINGKVGDKDAVLMTEYVAKAIGLDKKEILVASTGIIGKKLPIENIRNAVPSLLCSVSEEGGSDFSEAILTTDTVKKEFVVKVRLGGAVATIAGVCKGVGMIHPDLKAEKHATMLCFITTDVSILKKMLESALEEAISESFNMISVDGDMSTNDSCFVLANGLAGNNKIDSKGKDYGKFASALKFLTAELAKKMARDGEGATKFVEIEVAGAKHKECARTIARHVSKSNLLKCCIYGEDPNWGRVIAAAGASGVNFDPNRVDLYLGGVKVLANGGVVKNYDKEKAKKLFKKEDINIKLDLKSGKSKATAWTCDFSKEYVAINSEYST